MAAWSIWMGTHLFGDTIFGVKFMGVIWGLLTNILLYRITFRLLENSITDKSDGDDSARLSFLVVILYNLTIFAHLYSITIMPDTPLIFFWLAVVYFVQEWQLTGKNINWLIAGLALGLGLVSKYTAIAVAPGVFAWLLLSRNGRRQLLTPWPYLALILAALAFSPVIYWNYNHEWASFIFQFGDRARTVKSIGTRYIGQLLGSQLLLVTPFLFILFLAGLWRYLRRFREMRPLDLFFLSSLFIIAGFALVSLKSLVKMNWLLPGYPGILIITVVLFRDSLLKFGRWLKAGVISSALLIGIAYLVLLIPNLPLGEGNTWSGWREAAVRIRKIQDERGGKARCFLFTNSYKSAALLKFYLPDKQETYCQNVYGRPALQFDIWGLPGIMPGQDALYIFDNRKEYKNDLEKIRPYFQSLELIETFEYQFLNKFPVRTIYCYDARNYQPSAP